MHFKGHQPELTSEAIIENRKKFHACLVHLVETFDPVNREAEVLENGKILFDLNVFIDHVPGHEEGFCSTAACAIGSFALSPVARKDGWSSPRNGVAYRDSFGIERFGFDAAAAYLNIPYAAVSAFAAEDSYDREEYDEGLPIRTVATPGGTMVSNISPARVLQRFNAIMEWARGEEL